MSNPESFIDEVTEEVRRDKLFAIFKKYGWIGGALIALTVGGAIYTEWSKAKAVTRAQGFGDAVLTAFEAKTPAERTAALAAVPATGDQAAVLDLLLASDPVQDRAGTLAALQKLAADKALSQPYSDLAVLRLVILQGAETPVGERRAALDPIAAPGRPFRAMALEQMAYLLVEEGKLADAISAFSALTTDQEAPQGLRSRASQMIVALGGELPEQG